MGRARGGDAGGSLDLLLDTITNTLGGILFLAILLVLLPKASRAIGGDNDQVSADGDVLRQRLATAESLLESVRSEAQVVESLLDSVSDPSVVVELREASALQSEFVTLAREREQLSRSQERLAAARSDLTHQREDTVAATQQAKSELAEIEADLEQELNRRRTDLPLPSERETTTREASITVRYGRLYFDRGSTPGDRNAANLNDFFEVGTEGSYRVVTPKPWAGVGVASGERLSAEAKRAIDAWPARNYHFAVGIWDDSFEAMRLLRAYFASRGYAYRLIPVTEGDEIREGHVPNVRVQ